MKDEIKTRHENSNTYEIIKSTDLEVVDKGDGPHKKPVAIEKLIKWRKKGLTYSEIGSLAGVSKQSVHKRLKPFKEAIESLPTYKEHRADIFAILQSMLLNSLTESDIKAISGATRRPSCRSTTGRWCWPARTAPARPTCWRQFPFSRPDEACGARV